MPVVSLLLRDQAYQAICALIATGALTAGEPLSERTLAQRLAMGRTPVREAMRVLERDGVLVSQLGRGTYIRTLEANDIQSLYEVRQAIEGTAASLAARHGASQALTRLADELQSVQNRQSEYSAAQIDDIGEKFHDEVLTSARNPILLEVLVPLRLRFHIAFSLMRHHEHTTLRDTVSEHLRIFDAIRRRDESAALTAMTEHLEHGRQARMQILEQLGSADRRGHSSKPRHA